jgi:hypothetical protein
MTISRSLFDRGEAVQPPCRERTPWTAIRDGQTG